MVSVPAQPPSPSAAPAAHTRVFTCTYTHVPTHALTRTFPAGSCTLAEGLTGVTRAAWSHQSPRTRPHLGRVSEKPAGRSLRSVLTQTSYAEPIPPRVVVLGVGLPRAQLGLHKATGALAW